MIQKIQFIYTFMLAYVLHAINSGIATRPNLGFSCGPRVRKTAQLMTTQYVL